MTVHSSLHESEILGIAGLVGAGRSELARAIFRDSKVSGGTVRLKGGGARGSQPIAFDSTGIGFHSGVAQGHGSTRRTLSEREHLAVAP